MFPKNRQLAKAHGGRIPPQRAEQLQAAANGADGKLSWWPGIHVGKTIPFAPSPRKITIFIDGIV